MKKYIYKLSLILVALVFITGCQKEYPIKFDTSTKVVGFSTPTLTIKENAPSGVAKLYLGGVLDAPATDVTIEVSIVGLSRPAIEGTDFTISSKTITVGVGETAVTILPIDNNVFQGNKQFKLLIKSNSKSYPISANNSFLVTIADDEHPLKAWLGTYTVKAASYGDPGNWDEEWTVITTPVEGDANKISMKGIGSSTSSPIIASIDKNKLTITITKGQSIGAAYAFANYLKTVDIFYGFDDLTLDKNVDITGTINLDGTILIDHWGELYNATSPWVWDVFNTTWTKQ